MSSTSMILYVCEFGEEGLPQFVTEAKGTNDELRFVPEGQSVFQEYDESQEMVHSAKLRKDIGQSALMKDVSISKPQRVSRSREGAEDCVVGSRTMDRSTRHL